ncbi:hypothetical protein ABZ135_12820 [Streptomyces sp. NPDC006339]|uniref:hypothetical protein n=1 Tax=Streptomyces sp. NPDC006339 TaxID=3156755 RepID=UPI0033A96104
MPENTITVPLAAIEPQDVADAFAYTPAIQADDIDTGGAIADNTNRGFTGCSWPSPNASSS